jgi:hypothetical protein
MMDDTKRNMTSRETSKYSWMTVYFIRRLNIHACTGDRRRGDSHRRHYHFRLTALLLSLSPLIVMFSLMGSGNTSTLRRKPRFLASYTTLRGIDEFSEPVTASTVTLTSRFSTVRNAVCPSLLFAISPLLSKVWRFAFFLSASLFVVFSANMTIASSLLVLGQSDK